MDGTTLIIINMLFLMAGGLGLFAALHMRREMPVVARGPGAAARHAFDASS